MKKMKSESGNGEENEKMKKWNEEESEKSNLKAMTRKYINIDGKYWNEENDS